MLSDDLSIRIREGLIDHHCLTGKIAGIDSDFHMPVALFRPERDSSLFPLYHSLAGRVEQRRCHRIRLSRYQTAVRDGVHDHTRIRLGCSCTERRICDCLPVIGKISVRGDLNIVLIQCLVHDDRAAPHVVRITGEQITDPIAAAYFPDADEPLTVTFNATSSSFEIVAPLSSHGEELYMDVSFIDSPILRTDPDCINGYLILNPRTVNLVSGALAEMYLNK